MMYDTAIKVVNPAISSVRTVVPFSFSLKNLSTAFDVFEVLKI